jgi:hypothetical protein
MPTPFGRLAKASNVKTVVGRTGSILPSATHNIGHPVESAMTGTELREILKSSEFKQGLEEMSSYLASITQERPIVYLLAKCLWKRGLKFTLEDDHSDLFINEKRVEFKFNFDRCQKDLIKELDKHGDVLNAAIFDAAKGNFGVMKRIYKDVCIKKPQIFVWIISSRDLSNVPKQDRDRICVGKEQCKYNANHPYNPDEGRLRPADLFLEKLRDIRRFSLLKHAIQVNGSLFPSTYHFRICDFADG